MVRVYVLNVPEFEPLLTSTRDRPGVTHRMSKAGYTVIEAEGELIFNRRQMGLKPAVWYGIFTGGLDGEIQEFGREEVRVTGTNKPI